MWCNSNGVLNDDVEERDVECIQHVEFVSRRATWRALLGQNWRVQHTFRQQRVKLQEAERESALLIFV